MLSTGYGAVYAQINNNVKGIVKDSSGEPIIGASVVIKLNQDSCATSICRHSRMPTVLKVVW